MRFPIRVSTGWRPVFRLFGVPSDGAFVDLDSSRGTVRVKMGIWFDETLPLGEIESATPSSFPWYGGLGVKLGPRDAVSVVGSLEGVVALRFKAPQRMHVLVTLERPELRISLEDPEGFIENVRRAAAAAAA
jgi:hypothetical protein